METEVKFGLNQITNPTPKTATWVFRISLYVLSVVTLALNTLNVSRAGLTGEDVKDLTALCAFLVLVIHGATKMFGITIKPDEYEIR